MNTTKKRVKKWTDETFKELIWVFEGNKLLVIACFFIFFFLVAIMCKNQNKKQTLIEKVKVDSLKVVEIDEKLKIIGRNSSNIIWRDSVLRANGIKRK